jgi:two-component system, cell cycle sensor histidine kinase and response regulator CckA
MAQKTILTVEDDGIYAAYIETVLDGLGYAVLQPVATGEEAIVQAIADKPDLILMDIKLAGEMDGITAANHIKSCSDVPIIYLTSYSQDSLLEQARITTPYGYLVKPVSRQELKVTIEMALYRHALDRKLKESEEKYRLLFHSHIAAFALHEIICDAKGVPVDYRFLEVNPAFEKLTGLKAEEITGRCVLEVLPDTGTFWIDRYGAVTLTGIPAHFEHYSEALDKHFEVTAYQTEPGRFATSFIDITSRKRAEEDLKRVNERLSLATYAAHMGVWERDIGKNELTWDDRMYELYALSKQDFSGAYESWLQRVHPDDRARSEEMSREALRSEKEYDTEFRIVRPDGTMRTLKACGIVSRGSEGNPMRLIGVNYDITEQRQAEQALRESEQELRTLMDMAPVAIALVDMEGNRKYINHKFQELFGYTLEDVPTVAEFRRLAYPDPAYRQTVPSIFKGYSETGEITPFEATITCKDGSHRHVVSSAAVVSGMILLMLNDVTERKRLESELQQAQKMEAIGHLAGGVAHDFNNILTAIIGFGTLIEMGLDSNNPHRPYIEEILRAAERAARLTDSLLTYSRKQMIQPVSLNLNHSIEMQKKLLARLIGEDIQLVARLSEEPVIVLADQVQMDQVVMNLVTNARDAMPQGGTITIGTDLIEIDEAFIASHGYGTRGPHALLTITDTGCGMDRDTLQNIFNPFFTTKEVGKGSGLGLSVVFGIVKQNNGHVDVESRPGEGTTFFIYLPIVRTTIMPEREEVSSFTKGQETIFVAEDEEAVRSFMRTILKKGGYRVIEALNGTEAVRAFGEQYDAIDLVVLDVVMPGMNGKAVYEGIKKLKPEQKILFTSGYTDDIIASKGVVDKGLAFISKPIKPLAFLKKIRDVLDS